MDWNLISLVYSELHLVMLNFQVDKHHEKAKLSKVHPGGSAQSGVNIFTGGEKKKERKFSGTDTKWEYGVMIYKILDNWLFPYQSEQAITHSPEANINGLNVILQY